MQRSLPEPDLEVIAREWSETMREVDDQRFRAAMRRHRELSRFWPTEADIRSALEGLTPNRPPVLELPEATSTPEEFSRQATFPAMILASLRGDKRAIAFFDATSDAEREALAREVLGDTGKRRWNGNGPRSVGEVLQ